MANEEAFFIVVGVDKPTGDAVGSIAADFARVGMEDVNAVDLYLDLAVVCIENIDVGFTEDDEQVAFAGILQIVGHVQIGIHAGLEDWNPAQLIEF